MFSAQVNVLQAHSTVWKDTTGFYKSVQN